MGFGFVDSEATADDGAEEETREEIESITLPQLRSLLRRALFRSLLAMAASQRAVVDSDEEREGRGRRDTCPSRQ